MYPFVLPILLIAVVLLGLGLITAAGFLLRVAIREPSARVISVIGALVLGLAGVWLVGGAITIFLQPI